MLTQLINALTTTIREAARKATVAAVTAGVADGLNEATEILQLQTFEPEVAEAPILLLDSPAASPARRRR